jgi:gamma-glutamylcysteine synthetase
MRTICFEVTCDATHYEIFVDGDQIALDHDKGCRDLATGEHRLTWRVVGKPENSIVILGKDGDEEVVKTRDFIISGTITGGRKDFDV